MTAQTTSESTSKAAGRPRTTGAAIPVAIVGNPNCGKTTLFNALTGLRQKVGNYPGVTVEKKEGRAALPSGATARLLDLPGLYSITPHSPDEVIAREVLLGVRADTPRPKVILNVVDADNLERNLYLTSQLFDIGLPVVVALTMTDLVQKKGHEIDLAALESSLGVPVVAVVASKRIGLAELANAIDRATTSSAPRETWTVPSAAIRDAAEELQAAILSAHPVSPDVAFGEAVSLLTQDSTAARGSFPSPAIVTLAAGIRSRLANEGIDADAEIINARYEWVARIREGVTHDQGVVEGRRRAPLFTNERVDRIVMHPFWGYVIFFGMMMLIFQSIFTWVQSPMDWLKNGANGLGIAISRYMPAGDLRDLIRDGVLGGVGNTIVFLPQILLLFFFISLLEDTGYMARAAFLMDKLMSRVGLHGKSFIPLVSSFACAIPGIMATRTIGDRKARLITIMVAPLMSCSARLPVYALMIGAFVPNRRVLGVGPLSLLTLPGVTMISMYFLGMGAAFIIAGLFHRTLLKGVPPVFLMELPTYRVPNLRTAVIQTAERAGVFLKSAGTLILAISVILWFLSTYPKHPNLPKSEQASHSFVGYVGRAIEPTIAPLGFDWKMGIGIVSSFAAREVFVTAMGTVYNVEGAEDAGQVDLRQKLRDDVDPRTHNHVFTPLVAVCLMIYYVLAMQCMSTVAVVRRETNGWRWPLFQIGYMTALAWVVTFIVYQGGRLLGWG